MSGGIGREAVSGGAVLGGTTVIITQLSQTPRAQYLPGHIMDALAIDS